MNLLSRRQAIKALLHGLVQTTGSVVLASCVVPTPAAQAASADPASAADLQQRANQLAGGLDQQSRGMLGGGLSNPFANGGFRNGSSSSAFNNGAFHNGNFTNGSFHNGGFHNGGFANGAFRN
jgi:rSAM-associated Gly-rich repeat protein